MKIIEKDNVIAIKSDWTPQYHFITQITLIAIVLPIIILCCISFVIGSFSGFKIWNIIGGFFVTSFVFILFYHLFSTMIKKFKENKVYEIQFSDNILSISYYNRFLKLKSISISKENILAHLKIRSGRGPTHLLNLIDNYGNGYILKDQHGLWWFEDVLKIFDLLKEKKYKIKKSFI